MNDQSTHALEHPDEIRGPGDERRDGRPSDGPLETPKPADGARSAPTVAPEEEGGSPSTEHAPGGDL